MREELRCATAMADSQERQQGATLGRVENPQNRRAESMATVQRGSFACKCADISSKTATGVFLYERRRSGERAGDLRAAAVLAALGEPAGSALAFANLRSSNFRAAEHPNTNHARAIYPPSPIHDVGLKSHANFIKVLRHPQTKQLRTWRRCRSAK